jgi:predicted nuclease with TOPRIM domain
VREQLQARLEELKREFETGERRLRELEVQQAQLHETMLRIDGAMQVLTELLNNAPAAEEPRHNAVPVA